MSAQDLPRGEVAVEKLDGPVDPFILAGLPGLAFPQIHTVRGWRVAVADPLTVLDDPADLDELGRRCGWRSAAPKNGPPFVGGAAGFLVDGCSTDFVGLPKDSRPAAVPLPAMAFGVYDSAICVSPGGEQTWLVAAELPGFPTRPAAQRLQELRRRVEVSRAIHREDGARPAPSTATLSLPAPAHAAAVARILEWVAAGDLYQLNLTLQVAAPWPGGGLSLARRLEAASPGAAHAAYVRLPGGVEIMSVSPETFLRSDGEQVTTRPIKGTRPRHGDAGRDLQASRELRSSEKDNAEHVMIVDLERNDLGRVCIPSTVRVPELAALERHPTVWHLTSTVQGRLRAEVGLGGLLQATFPSGSVTGAPKRMAVARTRLVEPVRRGVYCGSIGVVSRGLVELSVAIRTAVLHRSVAWYGTGGAIVADSDPDEEFAEAMAKASPFFAVTGAAVGESSPRLRGPAGSGVDEPHDVFGSDP